MKKPIVLIIVFILGTFLLTLSNNQGLVGETWTLFDVIIFSMGWGLAVTLLISYIINQNE
jgi:hypothetical protein